MGLFKRAAVRGIAHELVRQGLAVFPSKEAMDAAADGLADAMDDNAMPEVTGPEGHSPEDLAAIGQHLIEVGHQMLEQAGGAGGPPEVEGGPPTPPEKPEVAKEAAELIKSAGASDYDTVASDVAIECMQKVAAEEELARQKLANKLVGLAGSSPNTLGAAAKSDTTAELDKKNRPEGYALEGMGKSKLETMSGHVGDLTNHPKGPNTTPPGSNSLTQDASKSAALDAALKTAASKLVGLAGHKDNSLAAAAKTDEMAALDKKNRPDGKYLVGVGNANFSEAAAARVGHEQPHPEAPKTAPAGSNSVTQASKSAEEEAFLTLFKKTAEDVAPYLPKQLAEAEKVAAITHMLGFNHEQRQSYLTALYEKVASVEASKSDAAGTEGQKESSLMTQIRDIAATASASAS